MKLRLEIIETRGVAGGKALALVDENGVILPNQLSVSVETSIGDVATAVVTFLVDGEHVCLYP